MVNQHALHLDRLFSALSDPTRRTILERVAGGGLSVSQLAASFSITLPAVMKHLDVLAGAGLIRRSKSGRTVRVDLADGALAPAVDWLQRSERFWSASLDRLASYAEARERTLRENAG